MDQSEDLTLQRAAVRDLVARYGTCADRGRSAELAALFTEDGVLEVAGSPPSRGRAEIVAFLDAMAEQFADGGPSSGMIRHHLTLIDIEPDGPEAADGTVYFLAVRADGLDHWGRYRDRLVRTDEGWRFRHRLVLIEGAHPSSTATPHVPGRR
jgi:uncharacterized protein (TIGR02246 family)